MKIVFILVVIVVVVASGAAPAAAATTTATTTTYVNGNVFGFDGRMYEAFAVTDNVFAALGSSSDIISLYPQARSVDLLNRTVLPSFHDAHGHLYDFGLTKTQADLRGATSMDQVCERLLPFSFNITEGEWLLARGWDHTLFTPPELPTRFDLDVQFPNIPVYIKRVDGHAQLANTYLLERVVGWDNIPAEDPEGGVIVRDESGMPTGVFIDNAMFIIDDYLPEPTRESIENSVRLAVQALNQAGITTLHDAGTEPNIIDIVQAMYESDNPPTLRLYSMIEAGVVSPGSVDRWCDRGPYISPNGWFQARAAKLFLDGALGSRGAYLKQPYEDDPTNYGILRVDYQTHFEEVEKWTTCGFQVAMHAIGDAAVSIAIDTVEDLAGKMIRPRIEHTQHVEGLDFNRLGALGIIASMQPTHCTSDWAMAEVRLGRQRCEQGGYKWRTLRDVYNVTLAFGSDFPVERESVLEGFYAAVTRQDRNGNPTGGWFVDEAVSLVEAIHGFTKDAAYACFQENHTGKIQPGMRADFVVLDKNIFEQSYQELLTTSVLQTYLDGVLVMSQ